MGKLIQQGDNSKVLTERHISYYKIIEKYLRLDTGTDLTYRGRDTKEITGASGHNIQTSKILLEP